MTNNYVTLNLGVACIRSGSGVSDNRNSGSIVVYYFIQIIGYMFRTYDYLQAEDGRTTQEHAAGNWNKIVNNY
jgi:hypothetical protein